MARRVTAKVKAFAKLTLFAASQKIFKNVILSEITGNFTKSAKVIKAAMKANAKAVSRNAMA